MRYTLLLPICLVILAACASKNVAPPLPADANQFASTRSPVPSVAATTAPTVVTPSITPAPPTAASRATVADQYRAWMEEARVRHPYSESVDQMWEVMICESAGKSDLVAGPYNGLFQYSQETWQADWNPYRDQSILDPQAQIFATAKAWHDGHQSWWGCYRG